MRAKLKEARYRSGMTQSQAAAAIGVCERYYRSLELGARGGKTALWDKLEDLFRVPQRELRENT